MELSPSKLYKPLFVEDKRYILCIGGRASGRSYAASQYALLHLVTDKYFRCAIMRFVWTDIRNSIYQEIVDRIEENELEDNIDLLEHSLTLKYGNNKINGIGFRKSSGDQKSKLKSLANYNCVIIEEADEVAEEDFIQLDDSLRTIKSDIKIILLLNPPHKNHWIIKRWFNLLPSKIDGFYDIELKSEEHDALLIHGTYKENESNLNQKTIDNFLKYEQKNNEHYYNMIEGLVSEGVQGRIFKDWKIISEADFEALPYDSYYGLDFGFSNDPAALVELKEHNDTVWGRELLYETGLTNQRLAERFGELGLDENSVIYADSAEPKSIEELRQANWNVLPATKGADSVRAGIDLLLSKEVYITEKSENLITETHEYKWALDKNKEPINKPVKGYDHACDAIRYAVFTINKTEFIGFI